MRKMSKIIHEHNPSFDSILYAEEKGQLTHDLSRAYTRPLYYGTSQQIGGKEQNGEKDK